MDQLFDATRNQIKTSSLNHRNKAEVVFLFIIYPFFFFFLSRAADCPILPSAAEYASCDCSAMGQMWIKAFYRSHQMGCVIKKESHHSVKFDTLQVFRQFKMATGEEWVKYFSSMKTLAVNQWGGET